MTTRLAVLLAVLDAQGKLEEARHEERAALAERDALIRQARAEGFSLREIGHSIGIHYTAVRKAAGEGGTR